MSGPQHVPPSLLSADRTEHVALPLNVDGALPAGLTGHVFFVAPVGTEASPGLPDPRGNTVMNGDGMIGRVDFGGGGASITTRLARTPDQIADRITHSDARFRALRFGNLGIARTSLSLGARDFLNTAFVPMSGGTGPPRLLLTYDAGRPFEIDPSTLDVVTPIGASTEWRPSTLEDLPFPLYLSAAHPAWDPATAQLFSVNYSRSVESAALTIPGTSLLLRTMPAFAVDGLETLAFRGAGCDETLKRLIGGGGNGGQRGI